MKSELINSCKDQIEEARARGRRCALNNLPHGVNGDPTTSLCVEGEYGYIPLLTCPDEEVKEALLKNNFIPAKLHELSFREQVNLFYNTKCVVGLHGAGFANLVFC